MSEPFVLKLTPMSTSRTRIELEVAPQFIWTILHACLPDTPPVAEHSPIPQPRKRGRPSRAVAVTPLPKRTCAFCSEVFTSPFSGQKYCSNKCKNTAHALSRTNGVTAEESA